MLVLFIWTYIECCYTGQLSQFKKVLVSIYFCADTGFTAWLMGCLENIWTHIFKYIHTTLVSNLVYRDYFLSYLLRPTGVRFGAENRP